MPIRIKWSSKGPTPSRSSPTPASFCGATTSSSTPPCRSKHPRPPVAPSWPGDTTPVAAPAVGARCRRPLSAPVVSAIVAGPASPAALCSRWATCTLPVNRADGRMRSVHGARVGARHRLRWRFVRERRTASFDETGRPVASSCVRSRPWQTAVATPFPSSGRRTACVAVSRCLSSTTRRRWLCPAEPMCRRVDAGSVYPGREVNRITRLVYP